MDFSSFLQVFDGVQLTAPTTGIYFLMLLTAILLVASGFASGSEIAIFSLSPTDLKELDPEKQTADRNIQALRDDSERTLATVLITNNFVNVTITLLCNYIFSQIIDFGDSFWLRFIVLTILVTFLLLLFGEIIPKIFARQFSLSFCRKIAGIMMILKTFFSPLEWLLLRSSFITDKLVPQENRTLSVDDLEQALELTDKAEIKEEQKILRGIIHFGDETVKEIMTSRQDVVALNIKSSFSDVLTCIIDNNYSRIPIYQNNSDNIRGVLYIKDLLPHLNKPISFRWQSLMRPPYFVPETKKIDDLLKEFQDNKVHIAIVVDEYGGTSGIVTLEDILEEIVGEINDEYDEDEKMYTRIDKNTYIFEGKLLLSDLEKILEIAPDEFESIQGEADTLAGLLLELKGDFLAVGEKLDYKNYSFEIAQIEGRRISRVKLTVKEPKDAQKAE